MSLIKRFIFAVFFNRRKEIPFIITSSFLISFVLIRLWVYLIFQGHVPNMFVYIRGVHIHHLNFGIFILAIIGFITLVCQNFTKKHLHAISIAYGFGLALTFDEIALWLFLEDDYYHRISYDVVITISAVLLNIVYFRGFWVWLVRKFKLNKTMYLLGRVKNIFRKKNNDDTNTRI